MKTTAFGPLTPFFVSANQVRQSQECRERSPRLRVFRSERIPTCSRSAAPLIRIST